MAKRIATKLFFFLGDCDSSSENPSSMLNGLISVIGSLTRTRLREGEVIGRAGIFNMSAPGRG